jgi:hypothetical protein
MSLRFIKDVIYHLKREYGVSLTLKNVESSVMNPTTGAKTNTESMITVSRAIRLPNQAALGFLKAIGYQKGSEIPLGSFQILLDKSDVPSTFTIVENKTAAIFEGQRITVASAEHFTYASILTCKQVTGIPA